MRLPRPMAIVSVTSAAAVLAAATPAAATTAGSRSAAAASAPTAYVVNSGSGTVTPIDTATGTAGRAIRVGSYPEAIAITPSGRTAYVVNENGTVTPITTATNKPGKPIKVGANPVAIAITPDGRTAYVVNQGYYTIEPPYVDPGDTVTPIATATNTAGRPIKVGRFPEAIAITPDGRTAYVVSRGYLASRHGSYTDQGGTVTPITTATNKPGRPITVGASADLIAVAITPNGRTAYVLSDGAVTGRSLASGNGFVVPIATATDRAGTPVSVGSLPTGLAITPDGKTVYVPNGGGTTMTPIATATNTAGRPISFGNVSPVAIAIGANGRSLYVAGIDNDAASSFAGSVTPVPAATGRPGTPASVGNTPVAIVITPSGHARYAGSVSSQWVLQLGTVYMSVCPSPVIPTSFPTSFPAAIPSGGVSSLVCPSSAPGG